MNILKHMEAVFVATVALAVSGSYMIDALPEAHARTVGATAAATAQQSIPVVVVSAKRLSPEEKQRSLDAERDTTSAGRT